MTMKILLAFILVLPGLSFGQGVDSTVGSVRNFIQNNQSLAWKTFYSHGGTISEGGLVISNVVDNSFEVTQTNNTNPGAGAVLLYGGIVNDDSQIVLLNFKYHEVYSCAVVGNKIVGRLEGTDIGIEISFQAGQK